MLKKFRSFLCLILAVILPLCFVACKSSKNDTIGGGNSGGETPEQEPENNGSPEISYVLDDAEINRILSESFDICKDFLNDLNESNLMRDNAYPEAIGVKTYSIFDYALYPARFAKGYTSAFDSSKTYIYYVGADKKFFDIKANNTNDKINATILVDQYNDSVVTAYFYEFNIDKGDIESLKISYVNAGSSYISFSDALLDFKNYVCEIGIGSVSEFESSRNFIKDNFTSEKFGQINGDKWSYSYYQKFDFSNQKDYESDYDKMPNNEKLISYFDNFGFLDVFDELDIRRQTTSSSLVDMGSDYFLQYSSYGFISYDSENFVFEMASGGEE